MLPSRQEFEKHFNPRAYLDEYFTSLDDEDFFMARFLGQVLRPLPGQLLAHEFGGGPTLYSVAALCAKAREIHFSDAVSASLAEVQLWADGKPEAFNWEPYIRLALEAEGAIATPTAIAQRTQAMRRRLTRLMLCDAQSPAPLGEPHLGYDLVAAHHCTDVAATTVDDWIQTLRNVSTLVVPGGWLIVSVTTGANLYTVGSNQFRCVSLTPEDIAHGYRATGYAPDSLIIEAYIVAEEREYSGVIVAAGTKLA
jgi:hypothetical protein